MPMATAKRRALRCARFWDGVLHEARTSPLRRSPIETLLGGWSLDASPAYVMFDLVTRLASPYDFNPFNLNPLRDLVVQLIDFDRVRKSKVKVFISATNVETGRAHVWDKKELTADHVMASACLPWLFQAVEIDGVPYWDGGFTGNPALWPLFENCASDDVVLVQINPIRRPGAPTTARDIINRVNEITFNASLLHDLRAMDFVVAPDRGGQAGGHRLSPHADACDRRRKLACGAGRVVEVQRRARIHRHAVRQGARGGRELAAHQLPPCRARNRPSISASCSRARMIRSMAAS